MPVVRVLVPGGLTKAINIPDAATLAGATIGTDLKLADGSVATLSSLAAVLAPYLTTTTTQSHRLLAGLTIGDDHPQYTRKDTLTARGDLYVEGVSTVGRLAVGTASQFLQSDGTDPGWATISPVITLGTDLSGSATLTNLTSAALNATITNNAVSNAKFRQSAGTSVVGNSTSSTANVADITASSNDTVLSRVSNALSFGQLTVGMFPAQVVTYAKIQNVSATSRFLGRITSGAGTIEELTGTQATSLLNVFTSSLQGLVPASSGGTSNFLRADGTFAVPAGTGVTSVTGTTNRITSSGGTTPAIDISASYVGQSSITTLGTISTGVWNGTKVAEVYGGTNQSTYTTGDILYASAANTLSKLAGVATGNTLISGGVSTAPSWGKIGLATHVSGVLNPANGGTGSANANILGLSGDLLTSGTSSLTLTTTGTTNVTFPTSGTLATTAQLPTGANRSVAVGLSAVNGTATTFARSDSAPALSQSISPTMIGNWTFSPTGGNSTAFTSASATNGIVATFSNSGATGAGIQFIQPGVDAFDIRMPAASADLGFYASGLALVVKISGSGQTLTLKPSPSAGELVATSAALTDGAGASIGTLTNAPSAGNPTKWIKINDNGTIRSIPAW